MMQQPGSPQSHIGIFVGVVIGIKMLGDFEQLLRQSEHARRCLRAVWRVHVGKIGRRFSAAVGFTVPISGALLAPRVFRGINLRPPLLEQQNAHAVICITAGNVANGPGFH